MRIPKLYRVSARNILKRMEKFKKAPISYEDLRLRESDLESHPSPIRNGNRWEVEDVQNDVNFRERQY
jgi:hypothetical protein